MGGALEQQGLRARARQLKEEEEGAGEKREREREERRAIFIFSLFCCFGDCNLYALFSFLVFFPVCFFL